LKLIGNKFTVQFRSYFFESKVSHLRLVLSSLNYLRSKWFHHCYFFWYFRFSTFSRAYYRSYLAWIIFD